VPPPETAGSALLDIAQRTLAEIVLPGLEGDRRTAALMVGSAIRMAAREIAQETILADANAGLLAFAKGTEASGEARPGTARELVEAIRAGRYDADRELHALLWADAAARASVSKPSALRRIERALAGLPGDLIQSE
jgi:hypothetical protein